MSISVRAPRNFHRITHLNEAVKDLARNDWLLGECAVTGSGVVGGASKRAKGRRCELRSLCTEHGRHKRDQSSEGKSEHVCG